MAVPVAALALRDDDAPGSGFAGDPTGTDPDGTTARDPAGDPGLPSGFRVESWHDVSVDVPSTWGHGNLATWCLDDAPAPAAHVVERPGGAVPAIGCGAPAQGYGLRFSAAGEGARAPRPRPSRSVTARRTRSTPGSARPSRTGCGSRWSPGSAYDARYVLSSVRAIEGVDDNGCPAVASGSTGAADPVEVAVCRYDGGSRLVQSERLTGDQAEAARAAVEAAPPARRANDCRNPQGEHVVLVIGAQVAEVQYTGQACSDRGILVGDDRRELTSDVLYWALSPGWSGGVERWVPLPDDPAGREHAGAAGAAPTCPDGFYANSDFALDPDPGGPMTVCRMERDWDGESGGTYLLDETVPLTAADSDEVRAALAAAPVVAQERVPRLPHRSRRVLPRPRRRSGLAVALQRQCGDQSALAVGPDGDVVERTVTTRLLDALGSPYGVLR